MTDLAELQQQIEVLEQRAEAATDVLGEIQLITSAGKAAAAIRDAIKSGQLGHGERLREQALAEQFQMSRGPIREALQLLSKEGLVEIESNKGAHVIRLDRRSLIEIFEIREMLLGLIHRRAADNAHRMPEIVALMRQCVRLIQQTDDEAVPVEPYMRLRRIFGVLVLHMSQNYRAMKLTDQYEQIIATHMQIMKNHTNRSEAIARYALMLEAISQGNAGEAEQLVRAAVRRAKEESLALDY